MKKLFLALFLLLPIAIFAQQKFTVSGYVKDADNGEELIGATIYVEETKGGTATNVYGFYSLTLAQGEYTFVYSFIGKKPIIKKISLSQDLKINIEMGENSVELDAIVIESEKKDANVNSTEMSTVKVEMKQIEKLPAFMGEVDILKTIQLLPGVMSGGEGQTGFFVRGGSADQNLILLDEAVVYNASHLFNFFSVFNPDAIKDVKIYKGGIPAEFGGRLSSVLDLRMKDGNSKTFKASGGLGLISSRLTLEGPIVKDKSSFLISGRRTYADLFLKLSPDEAQRNNQLYFYDLNAKINYKINDKNRVYLSGYFGRDITAFADLFYFDWGNATGTLRWNHLFSDKLFSNFSLVYSNYTFNIKGDIPPASFRWNSGINDIQSKADFTYYANQQNTIKFGANSTYHNMDPGTISVSVEDVFTNKNRLSPYNSLEHGIYGSNDQIINDRISLNYGMRLSAFQNIGEGTKYIYDKSNPLQYLVTDSVKLNAWETDTTFFGWEPRFGIKYSLTEKSSVKASYNRMVQYVQQSQSSLSVAPYDVWFIASNNIPPQIANQIAVGYFSNFMNDAIESSVELYYKKINNLVDIVDNANILGNELLESQLRTGDGYSYGFEFLTKKQQGKLTGWFGYTWSRTERIIPEINNGKRYFAPFDRRHDLSLAATYQISKKISVSSNFVYQTGRAITLPVGKFEFQESVAPVFAERNANRLIPYHRLDLSLNYEPQKAKKANRKRQIESSWNFSVYNVYARKNPFSISFAEAADKPGQARTTMFYLPGPIPSITWNFNF
jgi:hypothetical protein